MDRIDEIKARLEKATPGPWTALPPERKKWVTAKDVSDEQWRANHTNDANMIANAPADLLFLLGQIQALQASQLALYQELWGAYRELFPSADFPTRQLAERYPDLAQMWEAQKQNEAQHG